MIRRTQMLLLASPPRGRFSSMLELGGASSPSAKVPKIDLGKNNKVRAIALDFDLITRSIEASKKTTTTMGQSLASSNKTVETAATTATTGPDLGKIMPDLDTVKNVADLLNVELGSEKGRTSHAASRHEDDDLSSILGTSNSNKTKEQMKSWGDTFNQLIGRTESTNKNDDSMETISPHKQKQRQQQQQQQRPMIQTQSSNTATTTIKSPPFSDVRAKYAAKLQQKVQGGLHGLDRADAERTESLKRGDAEGHLTARAIASKQPPTSAGSSNTGSSSKWLASTGTGSLLVYLTSRSMKILLLPLPNPIRANQSDTDDDNDITGKRMEDLTKQLPQASFHSLIKNGTDRTASNILDQVLHDVEGVPPVSTIVVSDRDDYLRAAKERGMYTVRVKPEHTLGGNVSAHYTVSEISDVENVVNEINGISFNSVFNK